MTTNLVGAPRNGAFLLELLYFAGWQLNVSENETTTIRATRAEIELESAGASLAEAAAAIFARAMRSGHRRKRAE